jgi:hypothetical protein
LEVRLLRIANDPGPPNEVRYSLDEALNVPAALEHALDALIVTGHLATVVDLEPEIRLLGRRLGFQDPDGGADAG